MKLSLVLFSSLLALATSTVYFKDTFEDGGKYVHQKCTTATILFARRSPVILSMTGDIKM